MKRALSIVALIAVALNASALVVARTVRTAHFTISISDRSDASRIADELERAFRTVREYGLTLPSSIAVTIHATTSDFAKRSGAHRLHIAGVRGKTVHLQPIDVLFRRSDIDRALTHELVHVALSAIADRIPRWMSEGIAMNVAGERHPFEGTFASSADIDRALTASIDHGSMRRAYGTAERLTRELIASIGRDRLFAALRSVRSGRSSAEAFRSSAAIDLGTWIGQHLQPQKSARTRHRR